MENITEKQKELIALGKRMKEIISLIEEVSPGDGHPVVNAWVKELRAFVKKYKTTYLLESIWKYNDLPKKRDLLDVITDFRRILKFEGVFSQDFVE